MNKLFKISDTVKELLQKYYNLRDNDNELAAAVWYKQTSNPEKISALDFFKTYSNGNYTSADSITRCRRKLQEDNPSLRGKIWVERHDRAKKIREQIPNVKL